MKAKVKLSYDRATDYMHRFIEVYPTGGVIPKTEAFIRNIYVSKSAFPDGVAPSHITVTITDEEPA